MWHGNDAGCDGINSSTFHIYKEGKRKEPDDQSGCSIVKPHDPPAQIFLLARFLNG
jgi:hypothetical protein